MELKKSKKADLENKKGLFLEIGLAVSLLLMILVFSVSQKEKVVEKFDLQIAMVEEDIMEITRQDQKPPEPVAAPPQVVSDIIDIVKNDSQITTDISFTEFDEEVIILKPAEKKEEIVESDEPFLMVEEMPSFQGGTIDDFRKWVQGKLVYPAIAQEHNIQGKVILTFVIEKDGSLTNIQVLQSPDRSLADEATRVLKQSPKWSPGKQRNMPARVKYTLPVDFKLSN